MASPVSFQNDILPLFTKTDIEHMVPFGVMLAEYKWMSDPAGGSVGSSPNFPDHGNGRAVFSYLTGESQPQMPMGGPFWDQQKLDLYSQWMTDGFQQ